MPERFCPKCGKPEYPRQQSDFCYDDDCHWRHVAAESNQPQVQAEYISALDDAAIRQNCFQMTAAPMQGCTFEEVLGSASILYGWIMGEADTEIEEAAEPSTVSGIEECEPKRH